MIFTVARVQSPSQVEYDPVAQALCIRYKNTHRANGGRTLEVRFEGDALKELLEGVHQLDESVKQKLREQRKQDEG